MDATKTVLRFDAQAGFITFSQPLPPMPAGITVEFWAFGADDLPHANSLFNGSSAVENTFTDGSRNLNIHLPWHDESIFWDAGNDGGAFDRIVKLASAAEYKGHWRHWAFVKDVAKGEMSIYYEGSLWHQEAGKPKAIPASPFASIGSNHGGYEKWSGRLAEFRIWDRARTGSEITADKDRRLSGVETGLISLWPLDRINLDGTTPDLTGRCPGEVIGATVERDDTLPIESVPDQPVSIKSDATDAAVPPSPPADAPLSEVHPIAAEFQAIEPLAPDHIMSWKTTTSGLEDYALWRLTLKNERLEGDPPFRRGRIWA